MEASLTENLTPLQKLARAAQLMNPVQFDLPRDVACTTPLPGGTCLNDLCLCIFEGISVLLYLSDMSQ